MVAFLFPGFFRVRLGMGIPAPGGQPRELRPWLCRNNSGGTPVKLGSGNTPSGYNRFVHWGGHPGTPGHPSICVGGIAWGQFGALCAHGCSKFPIGGCGWWAWGASGSGACAIGCPRYPWGIPGVWLADSFSRLRLICSEATAPVVAALFQLAAAAACCAQRISISTFIFENCAWLADGNGGGR